MFLEILLVDRLHAVGPECLCEAPVAQSFRDEAVPFSEPRASTLLNESVTLCKKGSSQANEKVHISVKLWNKYASEQGNLDINHVES